MSSDLRSQVGPTSAVRGRFRLGAFSLLALAMIGIFGLLGAPMARADTIYTFTGQPFTFFFGDFSCPPECSLTGSFTVAQPLPPNRDLAPITPLAFTFTDGLRVINQTNPGLVIRPNSFDFGTDASGKIKSWDVFVAKQTNNIIDILRTANRSPEFLFNFNQSSEEVFQSEITGVANTAFPNEPPGDWAVVPEPTTLLLFGTSMAGVGMARWRPRRRKPHQA